MDGVHEVKVDFQSKTAAVTMAPGKALSREACAQAFTGTSYTVASFTEVK